MSWDERTGNQLKWQTGEVRKHESGDKNADLHFNPTATNKNKNWVTAGENQAVSKIFDDESEIRGRI